jgi:hypothetical protein
VRRARTFDDLFDLERVIKLETTDVSTIGYMRQVRYVGGRLIVLDDIQMSVMLFDDQGNFLRAIGRRGKGPGEYSEPTNVYIHGSEIVVVDTAESQILFYNFDGTHTRTVRPDNSKFKIFFYGNIILQDNLIYVCDFHSLNKNMPKHVVLDATNDLAEPLFGFGDRLPFYTTTRGRKLPLLPTNIFRKIDNTIWTIPGYQTAIDVFDLEGHKLASLPSGVDGITPEIVSRSKNISDFNNAVSLPKVHFLFHHRHFVFEYFLFPPIVNAFDANGNLIRKLPVERGAFKNAQYMENGFLISPMNITSTPPEPLSQTLGDSLFRAFLDSGYNTENYKDDNPYLILHKPKW